MVKHTERVRLKGNGYTHRVLVGTRKKRDHLLELEIDVRIVLTFRCLTSTIVDVPHL